MTNIMGFREMEKEVNEYFYNLTNEKFISDLELADYSFYEKITAQFIDHFQVVYGQIKISTKSSDFTATKKHDVCYESVDFYDSLGNDYLLAA